MEEKKSSSQLSIGEDNVPTKQLEEHEEQENTEGREVYKNPVIPQEAINARQLDNNSEEGQIKLCMHHHFPLVLYCDSCEEPICDNCTVQGPHNTQMHRIVNIMEAYNKRIAKLSHIINSKLIGKRDDLISKTTKIDRKIEEIKGKQEKIERDIRTECGYILERLKNEEGNKMALLNYDIQAVQKELEEIQEVKRKFLRFSKDKKTIPEFLACSFSLNKNIEHILSKPVRDMININPWDLPYELKEIREALDHSKVLEEALKFKKEIIYKIWQSKIKVEKAAMAKVDKKAKAEMSEWNRMTRKFGEELKKFQMVCFYCAELMNDSTVNTQCPLNSKRTLEPNFYGFTSMKPKSQYNGNLRHFFGEAREDLFLGKNILNELKLAEDKNEEFNPLKKSLLMHLEKIAANIFKLEKMRKISAKAEFQKFDPEDTGKINTIKFEYILVEKLGLRIKDGKKLIQILDIKQKNEVSYKELLSWVLDKKNIGIYFKKIL